VSLIFPKWTNAIPTAAAIGGGGALLSVIGIVWYYFTPEFWRVGYEPQQPVNYSHQLHAGTLGIDCRYCHTQVEGSKVANLPDTATCMNCHTGVGEVAYLNNTLWEAHKISPNLIQVRAAAATGAPIEWKRVYKVPDYAHFNHEAHVNLGISCFSCHGRVDELAVVRVVGSMSMSFCLECHRNPENALVDTTQVKVTDLGAVEQLLAGADQRERGLAIAKERGLEPPQHCAACHY
jgi:hypothetical protein